jgi:hypothetical protein
MPPKPQWLLRIPEILEELSSLDLPVVDRALIERIFGLKRRRAVEVLHSFGGYQAGRTFLVERRELLRRLKSIQGSPEFAFEQRRRERLTEVLEKMRKYRAAARVRIPAPPEAWRQAPTRWPEGVRLEGGRLTVEFATAEELLGRLFGIAQAAANDFERFRAAVEGAGPDRQKPL